MCHHRIKEFHARYDTGSEVALAPIEITFEEYEVLCDIAKRDPTVDPSYLTFEEQQIIHALALRELLA